MPQIEWFYAKNDQPCGPVSPVELKKFAEEGELHEEDLVWREGMVEWVPAGKIKGLFDANGNGEEPPLAQPEVAPVDPPTGEVPAQAIPDPPVAAGELPVQATPVAVAVEPREPKSVPQETRVPEGKGEPRPLRHPLDVLGDMARRGFDARFVYSTVVLFQSSGQIGIFLAIIALLILAGAAGPSFGLGGFCFPLALGATLVLLLVQHLSRHVFRVVERLDCNVQASLCATGPLDSMAAAMTIAGIVGLMGLSALAMATSAAWPAFMGLAVFVSCQFTAVVVWNPRAVGVNVVPPASPGSEASGQFSLLGKLLWRLSVVAYGTGIVLGSIATLNVAVHVGLPDEVDPRWFGAEMFVALGLLASAAPLPGLGYLAFLACEYLGELLPTAPKHRVRR